MKLRKERHAIARVVNEAGATASFQVTGNKHIKVTLTYQGRSQFVVISGTPGRPRNQRDDCRRARTFRELGYVEPVKAAKATERTYRRRQTPPVQRKPGETRPLPGSVTVSSWSTVMRMRNAVRLTQRLGDFG